MISEEGDRDGAASECVIDWVPACECDLRLDPTTRSARIVRQESSEDLSQRITSLGSI